ncbi:MAG: metallophosphoesterase [Anaerolineaceae bacterium]|nr:metallophosphoesterase [Anaerolineaceae bacterium]
MNRADFGNQNDSIPGSKKITFRRLNQVREAAKRIPIDNDSRIIIFSDCHRGDYGWADDFAKNQNLFYYALSYYFHEGYTYIELGDGDDLWKNHNFQEIFTAHRVIFEVMMRFYAEKRFYMMLGNHDIEKSSPRFLQSNFHTYFDETTQQRRPFFPDLEIHPGLVLQHEPTQRELFLVHGHQGDLLSDLFWPIGRFFVRVFWRNLQLYGLGDPTSAAKNFTKAKRVDKKLIYWSKENRKMIIAGHTHRPRFPSLNHVPYFNTGSVVSPYSITGIEIRHGQIAMIRWSVKPDFGGNLRIVRDVMSGPQPLDAWAY